MHVGKLTTDTAASRVYAILKARGGDFIGGFELSMVAQTSAVSTRISEIRKQLPANERIERITGRDRKQFYRLVTT